MTYTSYCLSDAMLRRLSAIANGTALESVSGGISAKALQRRGLIAPNPKRLEGHEPWYVATDAGRAALARARAEGW